jgi:hypothetical protein
MLATKETERGRDEYPITIGLGTVNIAARWGGDGPKGAILGGASVKSPPLPTPHYRTAVMGITGYDPVCLIVLKWERDRGGVEIRP